MSRIEDLQPVGDGTYSVRFWLTEDEANRADAELQGWAEGGRVVKGWLHTYKNFRIALNSAKRNRADLGEKLQDPGLAKGAIWALTREGKIWRVAVEIRGDILLDFAAVLKSGPHADDAALIEEAVGLEVPAYPGDPDKWADHFWEVLEPIYRRHFSAYRWQE